MQQCPALLAAPHDQLNAQGRTVWAAPEVALSPNTQARLHAALERYSAQLRANGRAQQGDFNGSSVDRAASGRGTAARLEAHV
jgi:hypothetical protein